METFLDNHGIIVETFLDNHRDVLVAMDLFIVPTVTFRLPYVLLVIQHDRRTVLHVNVTARPTAGWVIQQLREAFPFETAARFILLDRDAIFSVEVHDTLRRIGVQPLRTAYHSHGRPAWPSAGLVPVGGSCSIT